MENGNTTRGIDSTTMLSAGFLTSDMTTVNTTTLSADEYASNASGNMCDWYLQEAGNCSGSPIDTNISLHGYNQSLIAGIPGQDARSAQLILLCTLPFIFVLGMFGNVMTFITIRRSFMRKVSTCVYIQMLAVSDSLVLLTAIPWQFVFSYSNFTLDLAKFTGCGLHSAFVCFTMYYSAWLIVCISGDRFLHCFHIQTAKVKCTVKRAWVTCALLAIILFIVSGVNFVAFHPVKFGEVTYCVHTPAMEYFMRYIQPIIYTSLYAYIPATIIVALAIPIMYRLRFAMKAAPSQPVSGSATALAARRATVMVVLVWIVFVLLTVPVGSYFMVGQITNTSVYNEPLFVSLNSCLFLNYSVNFFLYLISVKRYRKEVKTVFLCSYNVVFPN